MTKCKHNISKPLKGIFYSNCPAVNSEELLGHTYFTLPLLEEFCPVSVRFKKDN